MPLSTKIKQALKAKAHNLNPVILIGNKGLTPSVMNEIDLALQHHELMKIRIASTDREARRLLFTEICSTNQAELISIIGNIGIIYKKNEKN